MTKKKKEVRKIVLIKDWGNMKKGEELLNPTDVTIETLCFRHKFGRLEGDPNFEKRMRLQRITMQKLSEDIAFSGSPAQPASRKESVPDLSDIVESVEKPAPKIKEGTKNLGGRRDAPKSSRPKKAPSGSGIKK